MCRWDTPLRCGFSPLRCGIHPAAVRIRSSAGSNDPFPNLNVDAFLAGQLLHETCLFESVECTTCHPIGLAPGFTQFVDLASVVNVGSVVSPQDQVHEEVHCSVRKGLEDGEELVSIDLDERLVVAAVYLGHGYLLTDRSGLLTQSHLGRSVALSAVSSRWCSAPGPGGDAARL